MIGLYAPKFLGLVLIVLLVSPFLASNLQLPKANATSEAEKPIQSSKFKTYMNSDYKIRMLYPNSWRAEEQNLSPYQIVEFSAPEERDEVSSVEIVIYVPATVSVFSEPLGNDSLTSEQYFESFMKEYYSDPKDYRMLNTSVGYIGNLPAHKSIMYDYKNESNYKVMRIIGVSNDTAYRISYYADPGKFNQYLPVVEQMAESFEPNFVPSENIQPSSVSEITNEASQDQSTFTQQVPSLNETATDTGVDNSDMIATQMKFGDKEESVLDMLIYSLQDQNFIVGNNSRICPDQNCKFDFKDTELVYQPGSNDITMEGTMKVDTGDVTKVNKFFSRLQPTEAREQDGQKIETVQGTFGVGDEPVNGAEIEYNVNGTLESDSGEKTLSLQGVQCNGINNDNSKAIDCNY